MTESIVMTNPLPTIPWGSNLDSPSEQNPFEIPTRESGIGFTGHDEDDVVIQVDLERDWSQSVRQSVDNMTRSVETNVEPSTAEGKGYKPNLYLAAFFVSASGWLFGFDTGSIGPVTEMEHFYPLSAGLQGFVVATILLTALIFSPPAGPLSEKVSRLHAITIGDSIFALGSLICASSQNLGMYLAGRAIAGAGEGLFLSTVGVWLVEAAPKEVSIIAVMIPCQFYLVDKVGRRPATIWGGVGMGVCMLTIGILFASGLADEHKAAKWTIIGLIYVCDSQDRMRLRAEYLSLHRCLLHSTWSIVIKVYANEIQPNATRASASSLAQCFNWIVNIVIALSTPAFLKRSPSGPYFLFGACCIVGALMGLTMPETKGLSMQGIDDAWDTQKTHLKGNLLQLKKFVGLEEQPPTVEQVQMEDLDQSRNHQE
ncbi:hypothetical protein P7C73_g1817, partial [Tremellales sp. Uapishka_1]